MSLAAAVLFPWSFPSKLQEAAAREREMKTAYAAVSLFFAERMTRLLPEYVASYCRSLYFSWGFSHREGPAVSAHFGCWKKRSVQTQRRFYTLRNPCECIWKYIWKRKSPWIMEGGSLISPPILRQWGSRPYNHHWAQLPISATMVLEPGITAYAPWCSSLEHFPLPQKLVGTVTQNF